MVYVPIGSEMEGYKAGVIKLKLRIINTNDSYCWLAIYAQKS
jgi:hypothetical protein